METQNVSAQVYFKQLPSDPGAGQFGCQDTGDLLSTCVNDVDSDAQIENAFQSQFGLSEYYKSPGVFMAMKRDYMDQVMGAPTSEQVPNPGLDIPGKPVPTKPMIRSGPRLPSKSSFGSSSSSNDNMMYCGAIVVLLLVLFYLTVIKK